MTEATAHVKPLEESVFIEANQDTVWNALTQTKGSQPFYFDSVLASGMRPGEPLEYRSPSGNATYIVGNLFCWTEVLAMIEKGPRRKSSGAEREGATG